MSRPNEKNDRKLFSTRLSEAYIKKLKTRAVREDTSIQELVNQAVKEFLGGQHDNSSR